MVFFITSFLPFIRPSIPQLKESDVRNARKQQKEYVAEICGEVSANFKAEFEFLINCKKTMK